MRLSKSRESGSILQLESLRRTNLLRELIKALAFQIGNEVSYNELANLHFWTDQIPPKPAEIRQSIFLAHVPTKGD